MIFASKFRIFGIFKKIENYKISILKIVKKLENSRFSILKMQKKPWNYVFKEYNDVQTLIPLFFYL